MFEAAYGPDNDTGYAAIDSIVFEYDPHYSCETFPPQAEVTPTMPPTTNTPETPPTFCNFEQNLCEWTLNPGLNSTESFVWTRTSGDEQYGLTGPQTNYDHSRSSKSVVLKTL